MSGALLRITGRHCVRLPGLLRSAGVVVQHRDSPATEQIHNVCSTSYATAAHDESQPRSQQYDSATRRKILVNRLLYRSKQRGFLEMDLLVGLWAQENVPTAEEPMLAAFEKVLEHENPDLFKWLTGQQPAPKALAQNPAYQALHRSVGSQLREIVQKSARTKPGSEWVRGWDDWKRQPQPERSSS